MHARYCSPWLGRFLSVDEIGTGTRASQSWNRYLYAYGNPLRLVDPDGLAAREYGSRCGSDRNCQLLAAIARDTAPAARAMEFGVRSTVKAGTALLLAETGAPAAAIVMSTIIQNVPEAQRLTGFLRGELRGAIGQMINTAFARGALDARQLLDSQIATGQVVIVSGFSDFVIPEDIHIDEKVEVIAPDPGSVITREELDLLLELNEFSNFSCFVTGACRP